MLVNVEDGLASKDRKMATTNVARKKCFRCLESMESSELRAFAPAFRLQPAEGLLACGATMSK